MKFYTTYDLHKPLQDYQDLIDSLKKIGAVRGLESTWFVDFDGTSSDLFDYLVKHIDSNDVLFVGKVTNWKSRNLPKLAVNLLKE